MKLFTLTMLSCLLAGNGGYAQFDQPELRFHGAVRKVEIREVTYEKRENGSIDSLNPERTCYTFNSADSLVRIERYQKVDNDQLFSTTEISRDKTNRVTRVVEEFDELSRIGFDISYGDHGKVEEIREWETGQSNKSRITYEYNEAGQLLQRVYYDASGYLGKEVFTYHANGEKSEIKVFDPDSTEIGRALYMYDAENRLVVTEEYEDQVLTLKTEYTYWPNGNPQSTTELSSYDDAEHEAITEYDSLGRPVKLTTLRDGQLENYYTLEYLGEGHTLEKYYNKEGKFTHSDELKVDAFGNFLFSESRFVRVGETLTYYYVYDSNNNWISCKVYNQDSELKQRKTRVIVYR